MFIDKTQLNKEIQESLINDNAYLTLIVCFVEFSKVKSQKLLSSKSKVTRLVEMWDLKWTSSRFSYNQ